MKRNYELDKLLWPKESLKRALLRDFPGCSNSLEALKKVIESKNQTATQVPQQEDLPELLRTVIKSLEELQSQVDVDLIPLETRSILAELPLTTREEILEWESRWKLEIDLIKW